MNSTDWKQLRFEIFQALDSLKIHDIYLVDVENNVVTICIIAEDMENLRPLVRYRMIDRIIETKSPDLYRRWLFCYEVWDKRDWDNQPVQRMFHR